MSDVVTDHVGLASSGCGIKAEGRERIDGHGADDRVVGGRIGRRSEGGSAMVGIGNESDVAQILELPDAFIVKEEEDLVFLDRTAHAAAGLVPAERDQ